MPATLPNLLNEAYLLNGHHDLHGVQAVQSEVV